VNQTVEKLVADKYADVEVGIIDSFRQDRAQHSSGGHHRQL
jgi:hypothetical protein